MADLAETKIENVEKNETTEKSTEKADAEVEASVEKNEKPAEHKETNGTKKVSKKPAPKLEGKALEAAIIRQVEYYFGDANLRRDKFLNEQIEANEGGWVTFTVLLTFNRLAALTTDVGVIVDALSKSEEGLVEISSDGLKIRRHPERPMPENNEERRKEVMDRTAYAKGFPLDLEMSDLLEFFDPFEKVESIKMRKYYDKEEQEYKFKGSVFVTFESKDKTKDFVEKEGLSCQDMPLDRKFQEEYYNQKREERLKLKEKTKKPPPEKKPKQKQEEKEIILPTGTVLYFEGVTEDIKREVIREAIEKADPDSAIAYIEFQQGHKEGRIRFQAEGQAAKFLEKLGEKKLTVKEGLDITLRTLSQDEEEEFLKKVVTNMKNLRSSTKGKFDKAGNRKRRIGNLGKRIHKKQRHGPDSDDE